MAKIDSIGRMRLPPDSGIRTQAYSQRERATSEPVRQAMSDWFQTIAQGRRENADQTLVNAVRNALTDTANKGEAPPRLLPLQILTRLADANDGTRLYQAQLGQSLLTLSSRTPLEPGQTLVITPGREGPVVVNPSTPQQAQVVLSVIQQQQLTYLPSPQPRTPLSAPTLADLVPLLRQADTTATTRPVGYTPTAAPTKLQTPVDTAQRVSEGRIPADVWRIVAEQLIDLRLSQLGNTQPTSMQEQLNRRAEQILRQVNSTYSPEQLKQTLQGQQAAAADPVANARAAVNAEQQTLLQVRQLLEQVSQQQQIRTLQGTSPDTNSPETLRQIQGIPVLANQQIEWFELERRKPEEDESGDPPDKSQRWVLDLHFQLPPLAPVCARLRWDTDHGRIEFLTDDTPTLRAFHTHLASLNQRMSALGLPIEDIQCRHGLPKRAGSPVRGNLQTGDHQIDIHT